MFCCEFLFQEKALVWGRSKSKVFVDVAAGLCTPKFVSCFAMAEKPILRTMSGVNSMPCCHDVPRCPNLCTILWQNEAMDRLRETGGRVCYDVTMFAQIAIDSKVYYRIYRLWCLIYLFICLMFVILYNTRTTRLPVCNSKDIFSRAVKSLCRIRSLPGF